MPADRSFSRFHALALVLSCALAHVLASAAPAAGTAPSADRQPRIFPEYAGVTLPPNIAPLNFVVREPGKSFRLELRSAKGDAIRMSSSDGAFRFSAGAWQRMLKANAGHPLVMNISVKNAQGTWEDFQAITNHVAAEEIDGYLSYRLLKPLYNVYMNLGIYQRNLSSFEERPVLENRSFDRGCVNCHTYLNRSPEHFAINIRATDKLNPTLLVNSNQVTRVDKTMGYLAWHPSGKLIAYSANKLSLFSHSRGETREVFDAQSDLGIYRVDSNTVVVPPAIALTNRNETWPAWSPDGRYLYFSAAPPLPKQKFRQVRYDLMRVEYDIDRDKWGEPETLVAAEQTGLSACQPAVSPNGKFVLFTMAQYGNFPVYQNHSDLYLLNLETRQHQRLDINSSEADSWHAWSSNGRWIVFSSKRLDGLFARPHFSYFNARGQFEKPFVLPQDNPEFYESYIKTFNVPGFATGPVRVKEKDLAAAVFKPKIALQPKTPGQEPIKPTADEGEGALYRNPRR